MKKIALIVGCAALIGAFTITAPSPSWAGKCNEQCQLEKAAKKAANKTKKAVDATNKTTIGTTDKAVDAVNKAPGTAKEKVKDAAKKAGNKAKKLLK